MALSFEEKLAKYAEVAVRVGVNVQPGQPLIIGRPGFASNGVPLELAPLARQLVAKAYDAGAELVTVLWDDPIEHKIRADHARSGSFDAFPTWVIEGIHKHIEAGGALLTLRATNPDLLEGRDPDILGKMQMAAAQASHPVLHAISTGAVNWTGITAPVTGWTDKVMADVVPEERESKLWEIMFDICRINQDDPVAAWKAHISHLEKRATYLNDKAYSTLRYTGPGTDLEVGLPDGHVWLSAALPNRLGIDTVANIPTEEIFTMPHKDRVNGTIAATKPLAYRGSIIDDFSITYRDGKVVDFKASQGEDALRTLLTADEGASRIGEVALVPHSSPISQTGRIFYNILIDENASNHIAIGNAYQFTMRGGSEMDPAEFEARGGNRSKVHVDFMVGSGETNIDGITRDGSTEPLMQGGEWVFDV